MTDDAAKHVWILNHYAEEPRQKGLTRHYSLARNLPAYGWKASIIAASTEHNTDVQRLSKAERTRLEVTGGVPFLLLNTPAYRANGLDRIWNMLVYTARSLSPRNLAGLEPPDVIVGSSVHPLAALAGWHLARRHKVPFVFEIRDLWPQTLIDMGQLSSGGLPAKTLLQLERFLCRNARRIITTLPHIKEYLAQHGVKDERITYVANGVDISTFPAYPYPERNDSTFELMYFGAHGAANSLDTLIKAMRILSDTPEGQRVRLRMIGSGPKKTELKALAQSFGLTTVRFESPVAKSDIPELARQADTLVICVRNLPDLYRYGISMNKLADYLASARPIIIASAAANDPVADAGAGWTVAPEDPTALAKAIIEACAMGREKRAALGNAGRRHVEEFYAFSILAGKFAGALDSCLVDNAQHPR